MLVVTYDLVAQRWRLGKQILRSELIVDWRRSALGMGFFTSNAFEYSAAGCLLVEEGELMLVKIYVFQS